MKPQVDGEPRITRTITSIGDTVARSLDHVRVRPRLRELLPALPSAEFADAIERHVSELSGVSLGSELLRSVPAFEPSNRDAFAQAMVARMRESGTKRHEVARLIGMSPDAPLKNMSAERVNGLITYLAGRGDLLASSTLAFLHERPSALLQMAPAFSAGVLARVAGGPPVSPFDEPGEAFGPAPVRQPAVTPVRAALGAAMLALLALLVYTLGHLSPSPAQSTASLPPVIAPIAALHPAPPRHGAAPHPALKAPPAPRPHAAVHTVPKAPKALHVAAHPARVRHHIAKRSPPKVRKPVHSAARTPRAVPAAAAPKALALAGSETLARVPQAAAPQSTSAAAAPLQTSIETDGSTAAQSGISLVDNYLHSLMSGDEQSAYADLGGASGERGLALSEEQFIDARTRIVSMQAKQLGHGSASVEVELQSAKGLYYASYQVGQGANGPIIASHDFIKP